MGQRYEPDRAFAEEVIAESAARGLDQDDLINRLLMKGAREVIESANDRGIDKVELIRRLLFRDRLANGYTDRREGHGAFGVRHMEEIDGGVTLTWWDGRLLTYCLHNGHANRWMLDRSRVTRTDAELELGLWRGFLDAVELCAMNLSRLRDAAHKETQEATARAVEEMKREARTDRHQLLTKWRYNGFATDSRQVPEAVRHVRAIKRFNGITACHVYFLLRAGVVVYVGQSGAAWPKRVDAHLNDKDKVFDDIWYVEVDRPSLCAVERRFIEEFRPEYNKMGLRR